LLSAQQVGVPPKYRLRKSLIEVKEQQQADRQSGRCNPWWKADCVIDNEQFRFGFVGQFRELFGRRMVLCDERLDAVGHLCEQFERLRFVNQHITAVTSLDRLLDRIRVT
jgi:hypothetical protein